MKKLLPVIALMLFIQPAFALTLAEKKKLQDWETELAETTGHFKAACGYDLPVKLDEALVTPFMAAGSHAGGYCASVISSMTTMCADPMSKEAIAAKVKSVSCKYKPGDTVGSYALTPGGALEFSFDNNTPNIEDSAKAFLEGNL